MPLNTVVDFTHIFGKSQSPASTVYCHQTQQIQAPSYLSKVSTEKSIRCQQQSRLQTTDSEKSATVIKAHRQNLQHKWTLQLNLVLIS